MDSGILVLDLEGRIVRWNRAMEALYGASRADVLGRTLDDVFPAAFLDALRGSLVLGRHEETASIYKLNLPAADGRALRVNVSVVPFQFGRGERHGTILIMDDVTVRMRLEQQLQHSEKMASVGLLAAGVAHEVNTPLTGISSYTQMLRDRIETDDPRAELLEKIEKQTFRAAKIINNLLNFSRAAGSEFEPLDVNRVLLDVLSLVEHQLDSSRIKVVREMAAELPMVRGNENRLQQVFFNLILNARDAMPSGGWLTLATRADDDAVVVEVRDTGTGIKSEDIKRIYDPFFTTKGIGRGTGLGLSVSYGILQEHGGAIFVDSAPGQGTTFQIALPPDGGAGSGPAVNQESILVIDDEEVMRDVMSTLLAEAGYRVTLASDGAEGLALARKGSFDAAIVDVMLPEVSGLEVLEEIKKSDPDLVVLMITAYASVETAIQAIKKGAFDYVTKPFKHEEVLHILRNALNQRRLQDENRDLRRALRDQGRFADIVGKSPRMEQVFGLISQAAPSRSTILVVGESGTGKELVAKAIHSHSARADKPFIVVNSGSLPHDLLESNLFGHVKGAFTGAVYAKKGLFELADKGTLFFDEIGNIPLETQAKLLRVMQEREFMRLGGTETVKVDVRLVAATNIDLRRAVEEGRFREDLFYRLNVIAVQLPALRQRKEDIPALVAHFVEKYSRENDKPVRGVTPDGLQALDGLRLAGQRPRARERHRAGRRPHHRGRDHPGADPRPRAQRAELPRAPRQRAPGRDQPAGRHRELRAAAHRVHPRDHGRGAEGGGPPPRPQAHHAQRDDQALQHPPPARPGPRAPPPGGRGADREAHAGLTTIYGPRHPQVPFTHGLPGLPRRAAPPGHHPAHQRQREVGRVPPGGRAAPGADLPPRRQDRPCPARRHRGRGGGVRAGHLEPGRLQVRARRHHREDARSRRATPTCSWRPRAASTSGGCSRRRSRPRTTSPSSSCRSTAKARSTSTPASG